MKPRRIGLALSLFGFALLAACSADANKGGEPVPAASADAVKEPAKPSAPAATAAAHALLDVNGCIDLTNHKPKPIALTGKLVVTYYDEELKKKECDFDAETNKYWCPSATATSAECAEVGGVIWCPIEGEPVDSGDPQELASFDLSNPAAGVTRWTTNLVHEAELDISPDGTKVVYAVRKKMDAFEDGMGIWVSDSDGKNARKVVDLPGHTGIPTWLPPNNDKFTFIAEGLKQFDMTTNKVSDILIDGFDNGYVIDPEASYDGKKITFKADATGGNRPSIYAMDFDGTKGSNVKQLTRGFSDHDPVYNHENTKIYFERFYGTGDWDANVDRLDNPNINQWGIVEVDASSGAERVLVPHDKCGKHFFWLPTISPDGKHLMFIHDYVAEDGYQDLWVSDIDGNNAQPVPHTKGFHWFDWSK